MPPYVCGQIPSRKVTFARVFPHRLAENILEPAVEYGRRHIRAACRPIALRAAAAEHLTEQHSERVHIAGCSRRLAPQLLRTRVSRSHHAKSSGGRLGGIGGDI